MSNLVTGSAEAPAKPGPPAFLHQTPLVVARHYHTSVIARPDLSGRSNLRGDNPCYNTTVEQAILYLHNDQPKEYRTLRGCYQRFNKKTPGNIDYMERQAL